MVRNSHPQALLASFYRNGNECAHAEIGHLSKAEKNLMATVSFCLLSCRDHIVHQNSRLTINMLAYGALAAWEIGNWSELPAGVQQALREVFTSNLLVPPPINFGLGVAQGSPQINPQTRPAGAA